MQVKNQTNQNYKNNCESHKFRTYLLLTCLNQCVDGFICLNKHDGIPGTDQDLGVLDERQIGTERVGHQVHVLFITRLAGREVLGVDLIHVWTTKNEVTDKMETFRFDNTNTTS